MLMNNLPRQTLKQIIAKYGFSVCENPKRCEALLRDLCGAHRREINILIGALEERVPFELRNGGKTLPREVLLARLSKRLQDQLAYTEDAAGWAVDSWAIALGVISEAEVQAKIAALAKAKYEQQAAPRSSSTTKSSSSNSSGADPAPEPKAPQPNSSSSSQSSLPKQATSRAPKPPLSAALPNTTAHQTAAPLRRIQRTPSSPPAAAAAAVTTPLPSASQSKRQPLISNISIAAAAPPRRGIGKLRGCLLVVVFIGGLAALAVFAVPAIITALRREQLQPSINEPRIPVSSAPAVAEPVVSPKLETQHDSAIRKIDFANFTYEGDPRFNQGKSFALRNGRYAGSVDSAVMNLIAVAYSDVTGDKVEEATVSLRANFAKETGQINYIYTISDGSPKLLRMFRGNVRSGDAQRQ